MVRGDLEFDSDQESGSEIASLQNRQVKEETISWVAEYLLGLFRRAHR